jgi:hypothetical protein
MSHMLFRVSAGPQEVRTDQILDSCALVVWRFNGDSSSFSLLGGVGRVVGLSRYPRCW